MQKIKVTWVENRFNNRTARAGNALKNKYSMFSFRLKTSWSPTNNNNAKMFYLSTLGSRTYLSKQTNKQTKNRIIIHLKQRTEKKIERTERAEKSANQDRHRDTFHFTITKIWQITDSIRKTKRTRNNTLLLDHHRQSMSPLLLLLLLFHHCVVYSLKRLEIHDDYQYTQSITMTLQLRINDHQLLQFDHF